MRQKIRKGVQLYSALLFPLLFIFFSPYIIIAAASRGIVNGSAVIFGVLLLFSMVFSRLFCGWLCPAGAIQDQLFNTNGRQWNSGWKNASKYIIWFLWFSYAIYLWINHNPHEVNFFYMFSINIYSMIVYFVVVTLVYVFTIATGKRGMCHSLCWIAPFMTIGERVADFLHIPRFRLKADSETCISCRQCNKKCPMSLNVADMVKTKRMDSPECISCLECVDVCPKKAIHCGVMSKVR